MRRMYFFARRNALEILRDPISLFFGICFPIILLLLLSHPGGSRHDPLFH